jgi:pyruvate,water dikinase
MHFLSPIEIDAGRLQEIGGKAANLHMLQSMKQHVPPWIVIPKSALQEILKDETDRDEIKKRIEAGRIERGFLEEIQCYFKGYPYLAVRSSAADEDSPHFSFAGQFESFLYVPAQELETYIKKVWLSAFSDRVIAYRKQNNLPQQTGMAIIIQAMIDADVSGVGFGIDPVSGDGDTKVISAVYGLGEGLVSGELDADTWKLKANEVTARLADKAYRMIRNGAGGLRKAEVDEVLRNQPALNDLQLKKIVDILDELAKATGKPQDIEFAVKDGELYLLQARPVTTINKKSPGETYIVWDNSNIIESYPGVTTPLTFSFILPVYEAVYKQLSRVMGVNEKDIEEHAHVYANMLGLLEGRVYYNLLSWYKLLALLPGYSLNAGFMEKMMGVKERFEVKDLPKRTRFAERLRVVNMILVMLRNLITLPRQRREFVRDFNRIMERYEKMNFEKAQPEELVKYYLDFEQTLIKKWKAPLVNDFFAMIYFGTLQKLISGLNLKEGANLQNDLLCGAHDIISTQPAKLSIAISEGIRKDPEAKMYFLSHAEEEILTGLEEGKFPQIKKLFDDYFQLFADRRVGELKLETITYKQNPAAFIKHIKGLVAKDNLRRDYETRNEREIRTQAEKILRRALKGRQLMRMVTMHFLRGTRSLVSNRENLRYERTRAFGIVRQIFIAIGRRFHELGILENPRDIFYLTKDEIFTYIEGTSVNVFLKELVDLRRKEFAEYETKTPAERIVTRGPVYHGNSFSASAGNTSPLSGDLKGLGCCPGRVKAKVRVVMNPDEIASLDGAILVTASTDPGWVVLFPTASAILVERGSLLSHSAIVSREMGIPCIVGITGLLDSVKTGDVVEMDGATGELKIVSKNTSGPN